MDSKLYPCLIKRNMHAQLDGLDLEPWQYHTIIEMLNRAVDAGQREEFDLQERQRQRGST